MSHRRSAPARAFAALAALAVVGATSVALAPSASGAVTATTITSVTGSPAGPYQTIDANAPFTPIVVTGTATAASPTDTFDLRCYTGPTSYHVLGTAIPAGSGTWSVQVANNSLYYKCILRAVATGSVNAYSDPSLNAFASGPDLYVGNFDVLQADTYSSLIDDYAAFPGSVASFETDSASECGPYGYIEYTSRPPVRNDYLFDCAANLYSEDSGDDGNPAGTNNPIVINGHNSYTPDGLNGLNFSETAPAGGAAFSFTRDPATGDAVVSETSPLYNCRAADHVTFVDESSPGSDCKYVTYAGVLLIRTTTVSHGGALISVTDRFVNAGASVPIALEYENDLAYSPDNAGNVPALQLPGDSGFATPLADTAFSTASWPAIGSAVVADDATVTGGTALRPLGTITWSTKPTSVYASTAKEVFFNYARTLPANGSLTLTQTYTIAASAAALAPLRAAAESSQKPTATLDAVAAKVGSKSLTVTGHVVPGGNGPITSVTVGTSAGSVPAAVTNGAFTAKVTLVRGANAINVMGTDPAGNVASTTGATTFADPVTAATPKVSKTKKDGKVTKVGLADKVTCAPFAPATGCKGTLAVKSGGATFGKASYSLAPGKSVTVKIAFGSGVVSKVNALKTGKHLGASVTVSYADPAGGSLVTKPTKARLA